MKVLLRHRHPLLSCFVMTALLSDPSVPVAFALIPAQVPGAKHQYKRRNDVYLQTAKDVVSSNRYDIGSDNDNDFAGDEVIYNPGKNDRKDVIESLSSMQTSTDEAAASSQSSRKQTGRNKSFARHGNLPDVHWRAIPMSHLRCHPNFKPLPPASLICSLPTKEHARFFRQESWQWDYLHQGRCTTSQVAAALGFLEPRAAEYLAIPNSLQKGGGGAWQRLRQDSCSIDRLEEMERILCESRPNGVDVDNWRPDKEAERTWTDALKLKNSYPFVAKYMPTITDEALLEKKLHIQQCVKHSSLSTRMQWGNAQEATSILTALNYFCGIDKRTTICEVGMCGTRFDDLHDSDLNGLKIGASPDAIICHGDGTVEVLEVKNHCPFALNRIHPMNSSRKRSGKKNKKGRNHRQQHSTTKDTNNTKLFSIKDFDLECKVPPVYIPQLMMEMFCLGGDAKSKSVCTSSIMVRQTGSKGAIILRLRRDEPWVNEMKYFLGEFKKRYVDADIIPPDDFFFSDDDASRYEQFLHRTKELSESVEQVAHVPHGRIQRMVMSKWASYESPPMFLDDVE